MRKVTIEFVFDPGHESSQMPAEQEIKETTDQLIRSLRIQVKDVRGDIKFEDLTKEEYEGWLKSKHTTD